MFLKEKTMSNKDVVTNEYSLLFGDCLERMKEIPDGSVGMILVDLLGVM